MQDEKTGTWIAIGKNGALAAPSHPNIGFIEGDGVGPDIWAAARLVLDAAVEKAYPGKKKIHWVELLAGEKAYRLTGEHLPERTLQLLRQCVVAIKGPLTTPVGGGIRSVNVTLRQVLDLYACIRPVCYYPGIPAPVKHPEKVNMVIFRENTEDLYTGIEWPARSPEAEKLTMILRDQFGVTLPESSGIGVKAMSRAGTERLVRRAIQYALARGLPSVTLVHKGNIMKFTEGAFREWGYGLALAEFSEQTVTEGELLEKYRWRRPHRESGDQRPDCRQHVPASPAASGRVSCFGHAELEWRLFVRRSGRPGRRNRHESGSQYRR